MTRQRWTIGLVAAAFTVSLAPVLAAQDTRGGQAAGSRPSNGQTTGSAAPRGGGDSGSSGSSSSSAPSGSSSSSGMGSSGSSGSGMSGYSSARERAPERPSASGERRGSSGERAMPRGSAAVSGENPRGAGGATTSSTYYGEGQGRNRAPVPAYSRPRDGRTVIGQAGERVGPIPGRDGSRFGSSGYYPIYDPYYYYGYYNPGFGYSYRYSTYWMPGYGYGLGYFGYDPFLFGGYYDPYSYGYGQGYPSAGGYGTGRYHDVGALRLKVKPVNAQVYVDGYFVGVVDSFDGTFQRLEIESGSHRVEVRAEGFEPVQFDVMVTPGETITYKGELQRIR